MQDKPFKVILLDLGGVLIELAGLPIMLKWTQQKLAKDQFWRQWLSSRVVRRFESGQTVPQSFAAGMIEEFALPVGPEEFLAEFIRWPRAAFPGTEALLSRLSGRYKLGTLSNTNVLHWHRFNYEMGLLDFFDYHFPSHLTGRLKPDPEAFHHVVDTIGCAPPQIAFFDDNEINVNAARSVGMTAFSVSGIDQLSRRLRALKVLS